MHLFSLSSSLQSFHFMKRIKKSRAVSLFDFETTRMIAPNCTLLKELLHCAIFLATCLTTPFLQTFSHYEISCFTGVTLSNVSCNLSRFDHGSHEVKGTVQTVATQPLRKIEPNSTFQNGFCIWSRKLTSCTKNCTL